MAGKLSVSITTYNEANILPRAIASVKEIADEINVIDLASTDNTKLVAKKLGANVYDHKYVNYIEPVRNYEISKASYDWILILDADEEVSPGLADKITEVINQNKVDYVRIPRKNVIFGHTLNHSNWWPDYNIRLFKKGSVTWSDVIHIVPEAKGVGITLEADQAGALVHHAYSTIEDFISRLNRYTGIQSELKVSEGYIFKWQDLLLKPANEFFSRYFKHEGYKDNVTGLSLALLQAFSEVVLYLKIWQKQKFVESEVDIVDIVKIMRQTERDLHYWQGDSLFKKTHSLKDRLIRKLRI